MSSVQLRPAPNPSAGPTSVGRLFEEYSDRIYGYCLRRLSSPDDAEDAVQMTFLCAHRALQRGVVPESETAWLFAIAKNVCRWQQRTLFRRNRLLTEAELDDLATRSRDDDEELLFGLKEALSSIPESQQRALVLREWHGLSSSEIARQLGMSQPATYALLTRARRSLAHALTALPQQAALGLVALVYEIRSHVKALFGGGAAVKTVAATTVVAAVAVGGVTVERAVDGGRSGPDARPVGTEQVGPTVSPLQARFGAGHVSTSTRRVAPIAGRASVIGESPSRAPDVVTDTPQASTSVPGGVPPTSSPGEATDPASQPGATSDVTKLPAELPEPPALPELPPVLVLPELPPLPEVPPLPALPPAPTDLLPPAPEPPPIPAPELPPVDLTPPPVEPPAPPSLPEPQLPKLP